jgi:hypothetical protein
MNDKEIRLEILRTVLESGSENIKSNPLPKCEEYDNSKNKLFEPY